MAAITLTVFMGVVALALFALANNTDKLVNQNEDSGEPSSVKDSKPKGDAARYEIPNFPEDFPLEAVKDVATIVTSGTVVEKRRQLALALSNVVLYGEGRLLDEPQPVGGSKQLLDTSTMSDVDCVKVLKACCPSDSHAPKTGKIDWKTFISAAMQLMKLFVLA